MTQRSSDVSSYSHGAQWLSQLTAEQRERLTEVLDRYLSALEQDAPLAPEALLAEHPDLADALRAYFRSLEELHDMAAGFGGAIRGQESQSQPPDGAKRIGDFELIREIGRGGMGVVYEARQISLDRRVAVKLLPFAAVLDARQIARFKHEAQAAAQLHHPNIVPVFAIGVERGVHYYAMQYIEGQPLDRAIEGLRKRVQGSGFGVQGNEVGAEAAQYSVLSTQYDARRSEIQQPTSTLSRTPTRRIRREDQRPYYRRVVELGIQAAEALNAAHEYGVVHRDIKPSNLLLEADGKLWITDFGLARFQRDASLTRTGDLVGTMRYMSPEQAAGESALVDHRTDIYSLGVTLYELVCLRPAFPEDRGPALLKQIDSHDPPRPRQLRHDIPADLETVILKAMARERDERYATAQQLADDLRCVLEGRATQARPPTALDRVSRWARRHGRVVMTSFAALTLTLIGLSASTFMIATESGRAKTNAARADRLYKGASEMLSRLGVQIAEELDDVPGAELVRQQLLDQTRRYYQDFIEEAKSDPTLRLDAALTYGKIGSLLEQLGSAGESLDAHQKAAQMLRELAAAHPGDFRIEQQLALAENNLAVALRRLGKGEGGGPQLQQAIRRQEKLLVREPRNADLEAELALSFCNVGLLQLEKRERSQAAASFKAAIEHLEHVSVVRPDHVPDKRKLAAAYNNLAAMFFDDRPADAARLHSQALELLQAAAHTQAGDLALRRELALTFNNLGRALASAGQPAAARAAYERAISVCEELVRLAPVRVSYRTDLAVNLNNLGMLENREGRPSEAEPMFRRAIELYEGVLSQFPANPGTESNLGGVYNNMGIALEKAGQLEAAAAAFASAALHQRAAFEQAPDLPRCRELLAKHYENQERALKKLGRSEEAAKAALAMEQTSSLANRSR